MSEARIEEGPLRGATRQDGVATIASSAAHWLSLAASPVFAAMALLTATHDGGPADILCSAVHGSSPLSGMTPMYVLMSVFHAPSWLKLISTQRDRRSTTF
jgi:hypothetical protein